MQQRYYDPIIGRFYSNDPVGFTASNPMMFNRYAYANNNPYKYRDPDGRSPVLNFHKGIRDGEAILNGSKTQKDFENEAKVFGEVTGINDAIDTIQSIANGDLGKAALSAAAIAAKPLKAVKMQQKVEKGQAPKGIKRFDKADPNQPNSKDHVHKSDGTSMNNDGTVHDKKNGTPEFTNKEKEFLKENGWPTEVKKE